MLALLLHSSSYLLYVVRNRPVFASSKRCGASLSLNRSDQPRHKQSKTSNGSDQDTDRKKTQSLGTVSTYMVLRLLVPSRIRNQIVDREPEVRVQGERSTETWA